MFGGGGLGEGGGHCILRPAKFPAPGEGQGVPITTRSAEDQEDLDVSAAVCGGGASSCSILAWGVPIPIPSAQDRGDSGVSAIVLDCNNLPFLATRC